MSCIVSCVVFVCVLWCCILMCFDFRCYIMCCVSIAWYLGGVLTWILCCIMCVTCVTVKCVVCLWFVCGGLYDRFRLVDVNGLSCSLDMLLISTVLVGISSCVNCSSMCGGVASFCLSALLTSVLRCCCVVALRSSIVGILEMAKVSSWVWHLSCMLLHVHRRM